jgi:Gas vesicle synthesis protein GvpO
MPEDGTLRPPAEGLVGTIQRALDEFAALTGRTPLTTTGVHREEDGWAVLLDVVELERVPAAASILATYRVRVDPSGALLGYERLRRFTRGQVDSS